MPSISCICSEETAVNTLSIRTNRMKDTTRFAGKLVPFLEKRVCYDLMQTDFGKKRIYLQRERI